MENKKPDRKNIAEKYANEIIRRLQEGTAPWQKPWKAGEFISPFNAIKENRYRGINVAILGMHGFADPRWMTFKQAQEKDWKVKKGSKSEQVLFWQWQDQQTLRDDNGNPVLDSDGKEVKETVDLARPRLYVYNVFHATQVQDKNGQDLPPFEAKEPDWNPHERAEAILRLERLLPTTSLIEPSIAAAMTQSTFRPREISQTKAFITPLLCMNSATGQGTRAE